MLSATTRSAAVGGLLSAMSLSCPLAEAQTTYGPRTIAGDFYQQTTNVQSLDGINATACNNTDTCRILFQSVPSDQALIVQHIACFINPIAGEIRRASLESRKGQSAFPYRVTNFLPVKNSSSEGFVNAPVLHLIPANERPIITLYKTATSNFGLTECSISGHLVSAP